MQMHKMPRTDCVERGNCLRAVGGMRYLEELRNGKNHDESERLYREAEYWVNIGYVDSSWPCNIELALYVVFAIFGQLGYQMGELNSYPYVFMQMHKGES